MQVDRGTVVDRTDADRQELAGELACLAGKSVRKLGADGSLRCRPGEPTVGARLALEHDCESFEDGGDQDGPKRVGLLPGLGIRFRLGSGIDTAKPHLVDGAPQWTGL